MDKPKKEWLTDFLCSYTHKLTPKEKCETDRPMNRTFYTEFYKFREGNFEFWGEHFSCGSEKFILKVINHLKKEE